MAETTEKRRPGRPYSGGETTKRNVRISDELWEPAKALAAERGENMTDLLRRLIANYIKRHTDRPSD